MQRWFHKSHLTIPCQDLSHPWMGLLLTEGETKANYSRCAATLVGEPIHRYFSSTFPFFLDWKQHVPDSSSLSAKLGGCRSNAVTAESDPWRAE